MSGLIGKKVGMTSIFDELGRSIPVSVIEVEPCAITQIKTEETDGYNAVQLSAFKKKASKVNGALKGHFDKAGAEPRKITLEFRDFIPEGFELGDELTIEDVFSVGDRVDVVGTSKGTGFTGVVKRHNFSGVGGQTHGQHNRERAPGAIGQASDPARVFKGMKMAGRSGNKRTKIQNLSVAQIYSDSNMLLVTGGIPGPNGGYVEIHNKSQS
ncbi:50S ribosomal protein L3 [Rhodohalobacter sp. SW132]|uniref:50S ribosomal protein L3 n=1 Tax=Rhodohalobacter sp. SW132 TaxID=2293433 RepID=UPI000E276D1D|nr:50S ribosomal protein L3 [Rhodohalobacter sp. SW132]REL23945.1 50S ribosomal protein L3 [Rhodohalobacter sp. SW132]